MNALLRKQSQPKVHCCPGAFDHITNIRYTYPNHSPVSTEVLRVLMENDQQYVAEQKLLCGNKSKFCYYIR